MTHTIPTSNTHWIELIRAECGVWEDDWLLSSHYYCLSWPHNFLFRLRDFLPSWERGRRSKRIPTDLFPFLFRQILSYFTLRNINWRFFLLFAPLFFVNLTKKNLIKASSRVLDHPSFFLVCCLKWFLKTAKKSRSGCWASHTSLLSCMKSNALSLSCFFYPNSHFFSFFFFTFGSEILL